MSFFMRNESLSSGFIQPSRIKLIPRLCQDGPGIVSGYGWVGRSMNILENKPFSQWTNHNNHNNCLPYVGLCLELELEYPLRWSAIPSQGYRRAGRQCFATNCSSQILSCTLPSSATAPGLCYLSIDAASWSSPVSFSSSFKCCLLLLRLNKEQCRGPPATCMSTVQTTLKNFANNLLKWWLIKQAALSPDSW